MESKLETSPYKGKTGLRRICNAALYSLHGLRAAYAGEDAFARKCCLHAC